MTKTSNRKKKFRIGGVPEHFNLPWKHAIRDGKLNELPFEVEFVEFPGGTGAMTNAMKLGELDAALLLFEGAVTNILRGHRNRLVKVYVQSPLIWGIHVSAKSNIENIEQIEEKAYAISRKGSGSHLIAIVDASERGWSTENMKFVTVGNLDGAREALSSGLADVFLWEKFSTQPLVDVGEFRRIGERIVPWPAFVVSVAEVVLGQYGSAIREMLRIIETCCDQFLLQREQSVKEISKTYSIKLNDSRKWFSHVQWAKGFNMPEQNTNTLIEYLVRVGIVENRSYEPNKIWFDIN